VNPRIIKEVRLLFWPWCLIVAAALLPLLRDTFDWSKDFAIISCSIGFFAGIPFLSALSLGSEFHHRTFAMLLGQPAERARIWAEKQAVLLAGLACAIPVFWFCWPVPSDLTGDVLGLVCAWLVVTVSSATFWTLFARSTMGGLVLGQVAQLILGATVTNLGLRILGTDSSAKDVYPLGAAIFLGYSGLMLWLGRRMLVRFQVTGGAAGSDLLMAGPRMSPAFVADWLRCRSTTPTLNLIRKELRLLRPLWLIMLLFLACWTCVIIMVRLLPVGADWEVWRTILPVLVLLFYMPLALILAGCLSLGEERSSGTHTWHLTLPVSIRRQWFIKLVIALGAGAFCGLIIPCLAVSAGQWLVGPSFVADFKCDLSQADYLNALVPVALIVFASFPSFWCASVANGSVRAALWVLPVMGALCFAGALGGWCAEKSADAMGEIVTAIVSRYQLNPGRLPRLYAGSLAPVLFIMPTVLVAIFQSHRMFRTQRTDGIWPVVRSFVPLAGTTFVCCWLIWTMAFTFQRQHWSYLVEETWGAVEQVSLKSTALDPAHPLQITVDDLAVAAPISEATRQWLRGATITVTQFAGKRGTQCHAQIRFPDGSDYPIYFYRPPAKRIPAG
jgi:hypothetical protein